jgi:hypothetical protein
MWASTFVGSTPDVERHSTTNQPAVGVALQTKGFAPTSTIGFLSDQLPVSGQVVGGGAHDTETNPKMAMSASANRRGRVDMTDPLLDRLQRRPNS